jgi:hypothetical protein
MKLVLGILLALTMACSDNDGARNVLQGAGYTDINTTGYKWFGCGEKDSYHTGFTAKGPTGVRVNGVVCCGMFFKGCTIRF